MLHIELDIDDIDYDTIVEKHLPDLTEALRRSGSGVAMLISNGMSSSMARKIIDGLPDGSKDSLTAELLNANWKKAVEPIEKFAVDNGVPLSVKRFKVTAVKKA